MDDRLTYALTRAIMLTKDKKTQEILEMILDLSEEISYMDWFDWEEYSTNGQLITDICEIFQIEEAKRK